jgi:hypothetical protein
MSERETGNEASVEMEGREPEVLDAQPDAFEVQLTQALRRVDAPEGFAARVMGRTSSPAKVVTMRSRFATLRIRTWVGGAIAAMLALGVFGVEQAHVRHEREQAALAQQQFETATRITDQALEHAREQLARAGILQDLGLQEE